MEIRFLEGCDILALHKAVNLAFGDYAINFQLTLEQLQGSYQRRGARLSHSVGLYDGDEILGFLVCGIDEKHEPKVAYDVMTGLVPQARGKGYSKLLFDKVTEKLLAEGYTSFLLEVLQVNEIAVQAYRKQQFKEERVFRAYLNPKNINLSLGAPKHEVRCVAQPDWSLFQSFWDWKPSWQNGIGSVERSFEHCKVFTVGNPDVLGYGILYPENGDIAQIAVAPQARRQGLGQALMAAMLQHSDTGSLRIVNILDTDEASAQFLEKMGLTLDQKQYEMIAPLGV